jgi:hypothetical protein
MLGYEGNTMIEPLFNFNHIDTEEAKARYKVIEDALAEAIKKHRTACEELTERQVMEALRQALACGDFQALVEPCGGQAVTYIPFRDVERLKARIRELEEERELGDKYLNE